MKEKIINSQQMHDADAYTIKHFPISSYYLMEKASAAFVQIFIKENNNHNLKIAIFCGTGNNGGDGWAIARILYDNDYQNITVFDVAFSKNRTEDNDKNKKSLGTRLIDVVHLQQSNDFKKCDADVIIDAIFGSGLNKKIEGEYEKLIKKINEINAIIYSVDIPSGLFAEGEIPAKYNGIKAFKTITFQLPKLNFFFPESYVATHFFEVVDIGLMDDFLRTLPSSFYLVEQRDIKNIFQPRKNFSHKGNYGHLLFFAGNENTMGAAILNCKGALFAGAGLISAAIPSSGLSAMNAAIPEVMYFPEENISVAENIDKYNVVAIGSGWGVDEKNVEILKKLMNFNLPLVLDADALTILAENKNLLEEIPSRSIITPHVKEFDRLFGLHSSWFERIKTAQAEAQKRGIIIVLKNQYTFICNVDGSVFINSTGNPSMAQGGMGDVLTGIISSFYAQGYNALNACILGCFIHGSSADSLAQKSVITTASDVAKQVPIELKNLIEKYFI